MLLPTIPKTHIFQTSLSDSSTLQIKCGNCGWEQQSNKGIQTLIEKDHLGDWSPEKDCCLRLTFRQPVQKPSSESSDLIGQ